MKSKKKYVIGAILLILLICAGSYYFYDSYVESQQDEMPKKESDENQTRENDDYDYEESGMKTFTVNGVSFNMIQVNYDNCILGSYIEGIGYREDNYVEDRSDEDLNDESNSESTILVTGEEEAYTDSSLGIINGCDEWADYDEGPTHNVYFSNQNYYIGETEVTVALWDAVMNDSVSKYVSPNKPIVNVSWYDCCLFIDRLNKATGYKFRLPTEAEWEVAACNGNEGTSHRFSGSDYCSDVAWYGENSNDTVHEVAKLYANELGLYDMSGNVWEWCLDYYKDNYYYLCKHTDPLCKFDTQEKVLRGGSFLEPDNRVRPAQKKGRDLNWKSEDCGFRLFLQLDSEDVYENICETDTSKYQYVPISKYYKAKLEKPQPFRVKKEILPDGIKYVINDDYSFVMKKVEGGVFSMGNPSNSREVKLTYDYYIAEIEVTNELYDVINRFDIDEDIKQKPVVKISYNEILEFIDTLNKATGEKFRLPTEAEWEFAARGGNKSKSYTYAGTNNINEIVSNKVGNVKQYKPNELGLYDMSGNVWEFCLDYYEEDFCKYLPSVNPVGCPFATSSVIAKDGGADKSKDEDDSIYLCHSRNIWDPIFQITNVGFRLCLSNFVPDLNAYFGNIKPVKSVESDHELYRLNNNISFKMINVKAGKFTKDATDVNRKTKMIVNSVNAFVDKDFAIGETEVTQELFYAVMGFNPSPIKNPKGAVSNVSWTDAKIFIKKLNDLFKTNFRLPTEYEWEFAAKGGVLSKGYVFSGSNTLNDVAWYRSNRKIKKCPATATKKPNELGLYDMSGNVWEWCFEKDKDGKIVYLGGGFNSDMNECTFINRMLASEIYKSADLGFRLAQ